MANSPTVFFLLPLLVFSIFSFTTADDSVGEVTLSAVLTLDASNFSETIAKNSFIVVEFYAPWCGHCKKLEPEYEKAAKILSDYDPSIVLAKVDANDEANKELASSYAVKGFPMLKILRNEGKNIQDYKGPREADGIVDYLKKQAGPASTEIKSSDEAVNLLDVNKIFIVGIFPEYIGEEFENFVTLAEKLRSDYDFGHTSDAKLLPRGDVLTKGPVVRLFKPFDELFVDFQDFHLEALEGFIESASTPTVTIFDKNPINHAFVMKFFNSQKDKVMLFINFGEQSFDSYKSKYYEVVENYKGQKLHFLLADHNEGAFQFFGFKEDQTPLLFIQETDGKKFLKSNIEPDQIATWLREYEDGNISPYKKSEPIPEVNDEPVKVVVANSLDDIVFKSGKNVLLEFYAPWCGHCKKLAPILDEVAVSLQGEADVLIAKLDATANDVPSAFEVQGYPTLYFLTASGTMSPYEGNRTAEDIIDYIKTNKETVSETSQSDFIKDEL